MNYGNALTVNRNIVKIKTSYGELYIQIGNDGENYCPFVPKQAAGLFL